MILTMTPTTMHAGLGQYSMQNSFHFHGMDKLEKREEVRAARRTTDKKAYCRMPHHRQVGLLPQAAPQTSGPIAACRTTDKWRFCHTTGKRVYLPFSLPYCKQVGLTQHTANQTENTGGGGGGGTPNVEVIGLLVRKLVRKP